MRKVIKIKEDIQIGPNIFRTPGAEETLREEFNNEFKKRGWKDHNWGTQMLIGTIKGKEAILFIGLFPSADYCVRVQNIGFTEEGKVLGGSASKTYNYIKKKDPEFNRTLSELVDAMLVPMER